MGGIVSCWRRGWPWKAGYAVRPAEWNEGAECTAPQHWRQEERQMAKKIMCAFGTDIDSVAGWIGSYGGGDSPSDIQRGIFATEVGVPRLLRLFKKYDLKTSF